MNIFEFVFTHFLKQTSFTTCLKDANRSFRDIYVIFLRKVEEQQRTRREPPLVSKVASIL